MAFEPPPEMNDERLLFVERAAFPWWPLLSLAGFVWIVVLALALTTRTDRASLIFTLVTAALISVLLIGSFKLGARRLGIVVGERHAHFARAQSFLVSAITEVELVEGRRRIKRLKERLAAEAGMRLFRTAGNRGLKGIMVPPGTKQAVLVRVDPAACDTPVFLLATQRPRELVDVLRAGLGEADSR